MVFFKRSDADGDFVLLLFDLICMDQDESGCVAVHARPDHIFQPHLDNNQRFTGGCSTDDDEFPDGHGNCVWMFRFPDDTDQIFELFCGLVKISADYFAINY